MLPGNVSATGHATSCLSSLSQIPELLGCCGVSNTQLFHVMNVYGQQDVGIEGDELARDEALVEDIMRCSREGSGSGIETRYAPHEAVHTIYKFCADPTSELSCLRQVCRAVSQGWIPASQMPDLHGSSVDPAPLSDGCEPSKCLQSSANQAPLLDACELSKCLHDVAMLRSRLEGYIQKAAEMLGDPSPPLSTLAFPKLECTDTTVSEVESWCYRFIAWMDDSYVRFSKRLGLSPLHAKYKASEMWMKTYAVAQARARRTELSRVRRRVQELALVGEGLLATYDGESLEQVLTEVWTRMARCVISDGSPLSASICSFLTMLLNRLSVDPPTCQHLLIFDDVAEQAQRGSHQPGLQVLPPHHCGSGGRSHQDVPVPTA